MHKLVTVIAIIIILFLLFQFVVPKFFSTTKNVTFNEQDAYDQKIPIVTDTSYRIVDSSVLKRKQGSQPIIVFNANVFQNGSTSTIERPDESTFQTSSIASASKDPVFRNTSVTIKEAPLPAHPEKGPLPLQGNIGAVLSQGKSVVLRQ